MQLPHLWFSTIKLTPKLHFWRESFNPGYLKCGAPKLFSWFSGEMDCYVDVVSVPLAQAQTEMSSVLKFLQLYMKKVSSQLETNVKRVFKIFPTEKEHSKHHLFFSGHGYKQ